MSFHVLSCTVFHWSWCLFCWMTVRNLSFWNTPYPSFFSGISFPELSPHAVFFLLHFDDLLSKLNAWERCMFAIPIPATIWGHCSHLRATFPFTIVQSMLFLGGSTINSWHFWPKTSQPAWSYDIISSLLPATSNGAHANKQPARQKTPWNLLLKSLCCFTEPRTIEIQITPSTRPQPHHEREQD